MKPVIRRLPKSLEKLTRKQLLIWCKLLLSDLPAQSIRDTLTVKFLNVAPWVWTKIRTGDIYDLNKYTDFLFDKELQTNRLILDKFRFRFRTWYGPGEKWRNLTCDEMSSVDACLKKYQKSKSDDDLNEFISHLYRKASLFTRLKNVLTGSDIRVKYYDRICREKAARFRNLPLHVKHAALYNFIAYRTNVVNTNKFLFGGSAGPDFGWMGVIHSIAGEKLGTIYKVGEMSFNNVLYILKKMENDRIKSEELNKK